MASPLSAACLQSIYSTFGAEGTYTPNGEGGTSGIWAIVKRGAIRNTDATGRVVEILDVLKFKRSDLDPPAFDAEWTDGTDTWVIGEVVDRDDDNVMVHGRQA